MLRPVKPAESFDDWHFPKCGIDRSMGFGRQPNRQLPSGEYARTTREGINVRCWQPSTTRQRGCSRPGMSRWLADQVAGEEWVVQDLGVLVAVGITPAGVHTLETNASGRIVFLVAVSKGNVWWSLKGDTGWSPADNNSGEDPPLNITGLVYNTTHSQKMFFVDGINYITFDPDLNSVTTWTATQGTLPEDSDGNYARLICTWRGRIVLSGILKDPQNWFMSAVGDPFNFLYGGQESTSPVAGNNSSLGQIGDVVTALIPYSDDVLIFGGDHTIYAMNGDPMAGGQIDLVSDTIGMAFGMPWCKGPDGTLYFFSSRTGIYSLVPGEKPVPISGSIEQLLLSIDTGGYSIRMAWNDRFKGLHVFVTPTDEPAPSTHFFYETRTQAWWIDRFRNKLHDPLCVAVFDGNESDDRVILLGGWDGIVRMEDMDATTDDKFLIDSSVIIGPIVTANLDQITIKDLQAILGEQSGSVDFAIYTGRTAEEAMSNPPRYESSWKSSRNLTRGIRASGHAIYLKISSTNRWAMEQIRARISLRGKPSMRGN